MALIDEVVIRTVGGSGGNGCVSFRREKYIPFGGPNGGNGGRGGSVILEATRDKTSLLDFKYRPKFQANRGQHGMGSDCDGRGAEDLVLQVPLGTTIYDSKTGERLADLTQDHQQFHCAEGGKGGRGNMTFATSTNRAPKKATPGVAGEVKEVRLELRLIADVGLLGLPNAGKSTLLRAISEARPKAASYPFTTLEPSLGVVDHKDQTFVVADLPGLIEGASQGAGLGHQFLRHVTRNRLLLHLVDVSDDIDSIVANVKTILSEIRAYDKALAKRPRIFVFTKIDLLDKEALALKKKQLRAKKLDGYFISAATQAGLEPLLDHLSALAPKWNEDAL